MVRNKWRVCESERTLFFSFLIPSITQRLFKQHENKFQSLSTVNDVECFRVFLEVVPFFFERRLSFTKNFHFHFAWHGKIKLSLSASIGNTRHFYHFPFQLHIHFACESSPSSSRSNFVWICEKCFFFHLRVEIYSYTKKTWVTERPSLIWETHWLSCNKLTTEEGGTEIGYKNVKRIPSTRNNFTFENLHHQLMPT